MAKLPGSPISEETSKFGTRAFRTGGRGVWTQGTILGYNAERQSYTVRTSSSDGIPDVPRLVRDPGEVGVLPTNTNVVLHDALGFWVIDSVLKLAPSNPVELNPTFVSEVRGVGGEDPTYAQDAAGASYRPPNDPLDVLSGDWLRKSRDGNLMGVLAGGTNVMKSGAFSQIRTHALGDLVEIFSQTYRHLTAMGDLNIVNDGGKTSLIWRAGSDQSTENGPNTGNWTIHLDVGATGDLFNFEVTTPQGQTLARLHMSSDGRVSILGTAGVDITSGSNGTTREDLAGSKASTVHGDSSQTIKGTTTEVFEGPRTTEVAKNDTVLVGNDLNTTVMNARNAYVGGQQTTTVQGGPLPPTPGSVALKWEVLNGGVETVVGNPLKAALPTALQGQNWINYVGGFNFAIQPGALPPPVGAFNVISTLPGSVQLGANGVAVYNPTTGGHDVTAVAPFGVMMYEQFMAMMSVLLTWMDTHVHGTAVGPSSPPFVPASSLVNPLLPPIRSVRVSVGA